MKKLRLFLFLPFFLAATVFTAHANEQDPNKASEPDILIFVNGDQLTGKLTHSTGDSVSFHSDMAGEITVSWSKIKELRSNRQFVVLGKNSHWSWRNTQKVPSGSIQVYDNEIELTGKQETQTMPIKSTADVLDLDTFNREARQDINFFRNWTGSATLGITTVQATQNNYTYTAGASLVRNMPTVNYLPPRNRSFANFSSSYSRITQRQAQDAALLPDLKTSIYHVDSERDEYLSSRLYLLGAVAFDHNFSQGLDLQQIYGGGLGWTVIKNSRQTLDLKATLQYEKQAFLATSTNVNTDLIGSTFSANYLRNLPLKIVFQQQLQYLPAYNLPSAYSANETNSLIFPLYKRFRFQIGTQDSYLNNPPTAISPAPPNKRNSFQFTTGINITLK
jgi:hypothetical protein